MTGAEIQNSVTPFRSEMAHLPEWTLHERFIVRTFKFKDFVEAISFVNLVAKLANKEDHHPDITIMYNKVKIQLTTHSAGGLTSKDFKLAEKVDQLL